MAQLSAQLLPGSPPMLTGANPQAPESWSASGALAFTERSPSGARDIWVLEPGSSAAPFLMSPFDESAPAFSPNGRLLAYASDESGKLEVYLRSYPMSDRKWPVSTSGGTGPRWNRNGKEIFYRSGNKIMAADVTVSGMRIEVRSEIIRHAQVDVAVACAQRPCGLHG